VNEIIKLAIRQMLSKNSLLEIDEQKKIYEESFNTFFFIREKMYFLKEGNLLQIQTQKAFKDMLLLVFPEVELVTSGDWNINTNALWHRLSTLNKMDNIAYRDDIFGSGKIKVDRDTLTIYIYKNKLILGDTSNIDMTDKQVDMVANDFKEHFPQFDEVIDFIANTRIASDRKASWLHILAPSSFGKSFLSSLFEELNIGLEVDYKDISKTEASALNPNILRNSLVMFIDEFKSFTHDMKKMSFKIDIAPKYGMKETVPLFAKITFSAEMPTSFSGAVDDQIKERVSIIKAESKTPIYERSLYKKVGNLFYRDALKVYIDKKIRSRINDFLAKGKYQATEEANKFLKDFNLKYRIKAQKIDTEIHSIVLDKIDNRDENIEYIDSGKNKGKYVIRKFKKTIDEWLKNELDDNEYKKFKYKITDLEAILDGEYKVIKNNGRTVKGLIVDKNKLNTGLIEISYEDKNGKVIDTEYINKG